MRLRLSFQGEGEENDVFWPFGKKKAAPKPPVDPLAAFDDAIESLERQASEVRRSAATLLTLRKELVRDRSKYVSRIDELERRKGDADERAQRFLERDRFEAHRLVASTEEALATADANAQHLIDAAESLAREVAALKEERVSARARLSAGLVVSEALRARTAEFDRLMKLDAARDEIERAHALAELYREDSKR